MDLNQLKAMCKQNKLATMGKREAIKRRLKEYIKTEKLIEAGLLDRKATLILNTDYFIVIDFEATCEVSAGLQEAFIKASIKFH